MLFLASRRSTSRIRSCSFSSSFSKTAAPSGGAVTSDTVTITVPPGNSGSVTFFGYSFSGALTDTQYSKNGGAFTSVADSTSVVFADGDTIALRGTGMTAGESWSFGLSDGTTGKVIGSYTITAS